jgi:hypothetical protein
MDHRRKPNLATIRETARQYPFLSEASIRDKRYHSLPRLSANGEPIPPNGWGRCFVKLGNGPRARVLLDLDQLDAVLEQGRVAPIPKAAA